MVKKDPAALFFIDKWFLATKEMKADCRGWFLNLILHQFDKKDLPNDVEELANLADVRVSEFAKFEQVFNQVLKQKFNQNESGRLENAFASEIIKGREMFKEKRGEAGKMGYFIKYIRKHLSQDEELLTYIKENVDLTNIDTKDEQVIKQVFSQVLKQKGKLFINENVNVNTNENLKEDRGTGEGENPQPDPQPATPHIDKGAHVLIVPELKAIWAKRRPKYQFDPSKDFGPLRLIGEAIAKGEDVSAYDFAGINQIKATFEALVIFAGDHKLYKNFQLSQFEKYLQSIFENFRNDTGKAPEPAKTSQIINNLNTAQDAAEIIRRRYANA